VLDEPGRRRVTDLARVEPEVIQDGASVVVLARVSTALGAFTKRVVVGPEDVRLEADLSELGARPLCSLRTAHVTLLANAFGPELGVTVAQGGPRERFAIDGPCDHTRGIPPLCTASAAFGATDGRLVLDDGRIALELAWDPGRAAALPLLMALPAEREGEAPGGAVPRLVRVAFSLAEVDDTFCADRDRPPLCDFALTLSARRLAR
jgi:hypothetical protein